MIVGWQQLEGHLQKGPVRAGVAPAESEVIRALLKMNLVAGCRMSPEMPGKLARAH